MRNWPQNPARPVGLTINSTCNDKGQLTKRKGETSVMLFLLLLPGDMEIHAITGSRYAFFRDNTKLCLLPYVCTVSRVDPEETWERPAVCAQMKPQQRYGSVSHAHKLVHVVDNSCSTTVFFVLLISLPRH